MQYSWVDYFTSDQKGVIVEDAPFMEGQAQPHITLQY